MICPSLLAIRPSSFVLRYSLFLLLSLVRNRVSDNRRQDCDLRQDQPVNIRAELAAVIAKLGRQSVTFLRTANEQTDLLLARERLLATLLSFFGAFAVWS